MARMIFHFNKQSLQDSKCPAWIIKELYDYRNNIVLEPEFERMYAKSEAYFVHQIANNSFGRDFIAVYFIDEIHSEVPFKAVKDIQGGGYLPQGVLYFEGDLTIIEKGGKQIAYVKTEQPELRVVGGKLEELVRGVSWILDE